VNSRFHVRRSFVHEIDGEASELLLDLDDVEFAASAGRLFADLALKSME
jgi:hypothetical protein